MRLLIGPVALLAFSAFSLLGCLVDEQEAATPSLPATPTTAAKVTAATSTSTTTASTATTGWATATSAATSSATTDGRCDWLIEYDQLRLTDDGSMPIPDDMSRLGRDYVIQICDFILEYARRSGDDPEGAAYYDFVRSACNADYDYFRRGKQLAEVHHAAGVTLSTETARMLDSHSNIFNHLVNCLQNYQTPEQQEVVRKCAPRALQNIRGYYDCLYVEWPD